MAEEYSVSLKVDSKDAVQGLNEANKAVNALDKEFQDLVQEMNGDADKAFESIQNKMLALAQAGKRGTEEYKKYAEMLGRVNQATNVVDKDIENFSASVNDVSANISVMEDRLYELAVQGKQDSEEFKNLVQQVGKLKRAVVETDMVIERAAATNMDLGQQVGLLEDQLYQLAIEGKENTEEFKKLAEEAGKLKGKIAEADIAVEEYAITNADLGQKVGILTNKMYRLAEAGKMNSKEFRDTARDAAAAQQQLNRVDLAMEAMSMTGAMRLQTAMGGVQGAFDFANGAMQLFGIESQAVQKAMMKFQAAMQMTAAIVTIQQALPAMTALKNNVVAGFQSMTAASKAFMVAGIGLLLLGIQQLVTNWEKVSVALGGATVAQRINNRVKMEGLESISKELNASDKLSTSLKDETLTRKQKVELIKQFQKDYPGLLSNINTERMSIEDINKQLIENVELLKLQAEAKAINTVREETYAKKTKLQLQLQQEAIESVNQFTLTYGESAKNGFLGFNTAAENTANAQKKYTQLTNSSTKSMDRQIKVLDQSEKELNKKIAALKKAGAATNQLTSAEEEAARKAAEAAERAKQAAEAARQRARERAQQAAEERKAALQEIADALAQYSEDQKLRLMSDEQIEIYNVEKKYKVLLDKAKKYGQDTSKLTTAQETEIIQIKEKFAKEAEKVEQEKQDRLKQIIKDAREGDAQAQEDFDQLYRENTISAQQLELDAVNEKYFNLIQLAEQYGYDTTELKIRQENELAAIDKKYKDEQAARDQEKLDRERRQREQTVQAVENSLQVISNLTEMFAGKSVAQQKKAFKIQKGVQIAQAIMDTYKAANAALASSPPPFNFIAAGAAITAGLLNVKKIADQKFEAATSGGGGGGSTSGGVTAPVQSPEFNIVGNANVNALSQFANTPIQTYVVSGDVTTAQALDRNRISNATL